MLYRKIGKCGVKVSEVALGSWLTYGGSSDDSTAVLCIERAYDLGINFFDTANVYANGKAEVVVGRALQQYERSSYVLATKCYFPMGSGPNDRGLSRKHIFEQCDASLKRLGTEYIDLYQCHRYDTETPVEETLLALNDLAVNGKILYAGVSEWNASQIDNAVNYTTANCLHPIVSNQPLYNMFSRGIEESVIPTCEPHGIGQVVFSPLAQGVLTGKYKSGQPKPAGSRASDPEQNMFLNGGKLDETQLLKVGKLSDIAASLGISMAQLALAWCLRQPSVSSVIIGASRVGQVEDNAKASGIVLGADAVAKIAEILA